MKTELKSTIARSVDLSILDASNRALRSGPGDRQAEVHCVDRRCDFPNVPHLIVALLDWRIVQCSVD